MISSHGRGPGDFTEQGGPMANRKTATVVLGHNLGVLSLEKGDAGGNVVGGVRGGGGTCHEEEDYGRSVLILIYLCE